MTFEQWWKAYLQNNMSCINYRKDFEKCWNAAYGAGYADGHEHGYNAGYDNASPAGDIQ